MRGILTFIIFCLILSSAGMLLIGIPLIIVVSANPNANFSDIAWYWHVGVILYLIISLKIMFKMSKWLSEWICSLFN